MNRRRPTTTGTDQLSLNLSVTRSVGDSGLASILLWPPGALGGGATAGIIFFLAGCLEVAVGMAQCGGPTLAALGGLCDGGSLLMVVRGTSVGGGAGLVVTTGADGAKSVGPSAVPDIAGSVLEASLLPGPPGAVPGEFLPPRWLSGRISESRQVDETQACTAVLLGEPPDGCQLLLRCIVWQLSHYDVSPREETHVEAELLHCVV